MKEVKFFFKKPGKDFEVLHHTKDFSIKEDLRQPCTEHIDHRYLGHNLYVYFDDLGVYQYLKKKLEYNINLPDSPEYPNLLFGNIIVEKVNEAGESVDVSMNDLNYLVQEIFYKVDKATVDKMVDYIMNVIGGAKCIM